MGCTYSDAQSIAPIFHNNETRDLLIRNSEKKWSNFGCSFVPQKKLLLLKKETKIFNTRTLAEELCKRKYFFLASVFLFRWAKPRENYITIMTRLIFIWSSTAIIIKLPIDRRRELNFVGFERFFSRSIKRTLTEVKNIFWLNFQEQWKYF